MTNEDEDEDDDSYQIYLVIKVILVKEVMTCDVSPVAMSFHSSRIATYHLRFYNSQIVPKPQNLPLQAHFLENEGPLAPAAANSFLNKKRTQLLNLGQASVKP